MMVRVLIADDHSFVREGVKQILSQTGNFTVTGEASDGNEALKHVRTAAFDLVLLDISMPGLSGLDVLKQIRAERPNLPVLILTMYPETQYATRVLKAGAAGYLTKDSLPEELVQALQMASQGRKYVSAALAQHLAMDLISPENEQAHEALSDREFQVFRLIATGKTPSEIADDLMLSVKTISTYRSRILQKLNMQTNADLTRYAMENELLD